MDVLYWRKTVSHEQEATVASLLKHGANVNAIFTEGYEDCCPCPADITVLRKIVSMHDYADRQKIARILALILSYSPDLNSENAEGLTPLEFAVLAGNIELIDQLIKHGAKLETEGRSSIHCASMRSEPKVLEHLLTHYEIDVDGKDAGGYTPLHLSVNSVAGSFDEDITETARVGTIALRLDHGADPAI